MKIFIRKFGILAIALLLTNLVLVTESYGQSPKTFSTAGPDTWVAPPGVTSVQVQVWGSGGGGGNSANGTSAGGSGGGGGGYSLSTITVVPGTTYYINVGAFGTGGPVSSTSTATAGGDSWFSPVLNTAPVDATFGALAKGGSAGSNNSTSPGGAGGVSANGIGTTKFSGGSGGSGNNSGGGGGGSSAGTVAIGNNGTNAAGNSDSAGGTAPTGGGSGGTGSNSANGGSGVAPGGGGGGSDDVANTSGGNGALGQVVLVYTVASSNADLSGLTFDPSLTLNPTFGPNTTSYTASVANSVSSLTVTPTVDDANATVKVNNVTVVSGTASGSIPLSVGSNTITVSVTAEDGTTVKTYTLTVTRAISTSLTATVDGIPVVFDGSNAALIDVSSSGTFRVDVEYFKASPTSEISVVINGGPPFTYLGDFAVNLSTGDNVITATVSDPDGIEAAKTYIITIQKLGDSNANLQAVNLLSPLYSSASFYNGNTSDPRNNIQPGITTYAASFANSISSIDFNPILEAPTSTFEVFINSVKIVGNGGGLGYTIPFELGLNAISIQVTAEAGNTKTYIFYIIRRADFTETADTDGDGVLDTEDQCADTVPGVLVGPDGCRLDQKFVLSVDYGAQDPATAKIQTGDRVQMTVTRADLNDNLVTSGDQVVYLSSSIIGGAMWSDMSGGKIINRVVIPAGQSSAVFYFTSCIRSSKNANIIVTASDSRPSDGANGIDDGVAEVIVVGNNICGPLSVNNDLNGLEVKSGSTVYSLIPAFSASTLSYTVNVPSNVFTLDVKAIVADPTSTLYIDGNDAISDIYYNGINLIVGLNVIQVEVLSTNGISKIYTINVTKKSVNANLASLEVTKADDAAVVYALTPAFPDASNTFSTDVENLVTSARLALSAEIPGSSIQVFEIVGDTETEIIEVSSGEYQLVGLLVGPNNYKIIVTPLDEEAATKEYILVINRAPSNISTLADLVVTHLTESITYTLDPAFNSGTLEYDTEVGNLVTDVNVTLTLSDVNSSVVVSYGGDVIQPNNNTYTISGLKVFDNLVSLTVTAEDGEATKTYELTINRLPSDNAYLSTLILDNPYASVFPVFSGRTAFEYAASVRNSVTSLPITITTEEPNATASVSINGTVSNISLNEIGTGSFTASSLVVGRNLVLITITAQDGTTLQVYTLYLTRRADDATTPDTDGDGVLDDVDQCPTTAPGATVGESGCVVLFVIDINPNETSPGQKNSVKVCETIEVLIIREAENGDRITEGNQIAYLFATYGAFRDALGRPINKVTIPSGSSSVSVFYIADDKKADGQETPYTISVSEVRPANGVLGIVDASAEIRVNGATGNPNGISACTFSDNASLTNLFMSPVNFAQAFSPAVFAYSQTVGFSVSSVTLTPTVALPTKTTVYVNGKIVASGAASQSLALNVGVNLLTVEVLAENGDFLTYTVTVTRLNGDADLINLSINPGTLAPAFDRNTTGYTASLANDVTSVRVTASVSDPEAQIRINGTIVGSGVASAPIALTVGVNTINVVVYAEDRSITKTYVITITRAASANADLAALVLLTADNATVAYSPGFADNTLQYNSTVVNAIDAITVTPTLSDNTASILVNGIAVTNGTASALIELNVGSNLITVQVTAQNGSVKTYLITVVRLDVPIEEKDTDNDGVTDDKDQCPDTPAGEVVDEFGCSDSQKDTDNDGVTDDKDLCPDTPAGEEVDEDGCADSQKDSDGDGVTDDKDLCPDTPAGEEVDEDGCADSQKDTDNDGVTDDKDLCPDTPAGEEVDEDGCADSQKDTDNDGVTDDKDLCPDTPAGEEVDEDGCADSQKDTDNDGVTDDKDLCPDTPAGEEVDEDGCADSQKDSDGDGVTDDKDLCPDTPAGEKADEDGCADSQKDSDGDGVTDDKDLCPDTPAGEEVDEDGCADSQKDSDGDGVTDDKDLCPDTPAGEEVDEDGCADSQKDTDNDGITDDKDLCPDTPAGEEVDEDGCADSQKDTDNDGVTDDKDLCPDTPAGEEVDEDGCADSQKDTDNDGVTDDKDLCPDTPAGEEVDEDGCADSQKDSDGDGVTDDKDLCPDTPAGVIVDGKGCPDLSIDTDGDEVPDYIETVEGTNPEDCDDFKDSDKDGVPDYVESVEETNPGDAKSFLDANENSVPDYLERRGIESIFEVNTITVPWGTLIQNVAFPDDVLAVTGTGAVVNVEVDWKITGYNGFKSGTYTFRGSVTTPSCLGNPLNLETQIQIIVESKPKPLDLLLSNNTFEADASKDFIFIGNFTVVDPTDNQHVIELDGNGFDNKYFEIKQGILFWSSSDPVPGRTTFTISVKVTDRAGNVFTKTFTITRTRKSFNQIEVPNTFTPNGDGFNESWGIPDLKFYTGVRIQIFDRNGDRLFVTNDARNRWNGTANGKEYPVASYLYVIEVAELGEIRKGILNLLKY